MCWNTNGLLGKNRTKLKYIQDSAVNEDAILNVSTKPKPMKTSTTPKREILTIVSVNIWRGLDVKVKQLSELVEKHKVDILMLQETDIKG